MMLTSVSENWVPFLLLLMIAVILLWWLGRRYAQDVETPSMDEPAPKLTDDISHKVAPPIVQGPEDDAPKDEAPPETITAAPKKTVAAKAEPIAKAQTPDNLELLKGVGPKLNDLLKTLGVTNFTQIANWTADDIAEIDSKLGNFAGRIQRENWVEQARFLANGDIAAFETKYGALGGDVKKS